MTTLDPLLYCDGKLRLTRHGDRAGGTVLMHVPSNLQFDVPDDQTPLLVSDLEGLLLDGEEPERAWTKLRNYYHARFHRAAA